jgi:hypothetical protein
VFDLPYSELMLHEVPLVVLTPAKVRTLVWFIVMVAVRLRPSSCATLTGLDVPPIFKGPLDGIVMLAPYGVP